MSNEIKAPEIAEEKKGKTNAERAREKKAEYKKAAASILALLDKKGVTKELKAEDLAFLKSFAEYDPSNAQRGSVFAVLFPEPKVGASITLGEAMAKTLKGEQVLKHYIANWAEKGTVVEYVKDKVPVNSKFTIKALPQG